MANDKLPHERLRDWADIAERKGTFPSTLMDEELGEGFGENLKHCDSVAFRRLADEVEDAIESAYMDGTCHYCDMIAAEQGWPKRKADELVEDYVKRCFLLRPMFEDDEPAQPGDVFESPIGIQERIDYFSVFDWGYRIECGKDGRAWLDLMRGDRLKRPAPKVLDGDGVPTEVGDAVWLKRPEDVNGASTLRGRLTVTEVDRFFVAVRSDSGETAIPHPAMLTHREPDSLEKLRDDMRGYADGGVSCIEDDMRMFADRLTAIVERGAE